jgi:hypothetical protein
MSSETKTGLHIEKIEPTVFIRRGPNGLEQRIRLTVANSGAAVSGTCEIHIGNERVSLPFGPIPAGESTHDVYLKETASPCTAKVVLKIGGETADQKTFDAKPQRHWVIHVVQSSHHDVGYTDLASNVIPEHARHLDQVIEFAAATKDYPDDAQFRMIIEQAWSIDHYLKTAPPARAAAMIDLMRTGRVELTALFGNMTTEICGHETLARCLYHAFRLKRLYGIPIISAEHNDIPGFSWGLSTVLTEAGIKLFSPEIPQYYHWGQTGNVRSFWDQKAIFGYDGPGAFWWQAPSGKRVLFWDNNNGCGGDTRLSLPSLEWTLARIERTTFPFSTLRWIVLGASRDNSPYIEGYTRTIRQWNETWAYPHLVCSTNAKFYHDLVRQIPENLPVWHGELPGQDYPCASMSTAEGTSVNRNNSVAFFAAECRSTIARAVTGTRDRQATLMQATEEILWYDEHAWGHHFPCGPTCRTSELEKAVRTHRASALIHDVSCKSMAALADAIQIDEQYPHLVVFNPHPQPGQGMVRTPLREMDNCGSEIIPSTLQDEPEGEEHLRGVLLNSHWHVNPNPDIMTGKFDLIDLATGNAVPFEIITLDSADIPVPFASQRLGIGSGGKRYGAMEVPLGLKQELIFKVTDIPPCGYKTFGLRPRPEIPTFTNPFTVTENSIENEFYRIRADRTTGAIVSIFDKETRTELLDQAAPYSFGEVVARSPEKEEIFRAKDRCITQITAGAMTATINRTMNLLGHPHIRQSFTLYPGLKYVEMGMRVLKDGTPLLDVHTAFPFAVDTPQFRHEGVLCTMEPVTDFLPGAYWNSIPVRNYVTVQDKSSAVAWSSLDTPIVSLGDLWALKVSPAHRCVKNPESPQPPDSVKELKHGWIFSMVFDNNFGTNFTVSQNGDFLFRYRFTSGRPATVLAGPFGRQAMAPFETIFTQHHRPRTLPPKQGFLEIDSPDIALLACKQAEDGRGYILRLWNPGKNDERVTVKVGFAKIATANLTTLAEEDLPDTIPCKENGLVVDCKAGAVITIRIINR